MLLLGTTITVDGITIYPDHADPNQFWYLPGPVALAKRDDGQLSFTLIRYRPAAVVGGVKGGGFMMFETDLKLSESTRTDIMSQISALAPGDAILSPALFESGTVQCVALNVQGPGGTVAGPAAQGSFQAVESILGASLPSMTGDEDAIFSLTLSQDGADIMNAAFDAGAQPTGVIYNLTFLGIRPALDVRITADYKRIFDELSASLTATVYYVQAGIDATLEKLKEDGAIKMEVLAFTDDADLAAKEDWAMNFFRDKLLTEWFQPSLQPIPSLASGTAVAGATNPTPFPGTPSTPPVRPPLPPAPPVGQVPPRPAGSLPPAPPGVVGPPQTVGAPGTMPGVVSPPQTVGAPGTMPGVAAPSRRVGAAAGAVAGAVGGRAWWRCGRRRLRSRSGRGRRRSGG